MCILHVEDCNSGKKMKHCSLTTIQARPLKILSIVVSSLNLLEDKNCQRIKSNDWTLFLFVANIGWIVIGDDYWCLL
jgi:hypothetical protein